jgi:hypothetical protein
MVIDSPDTSGGSVNTREEAEGWALVLNFAIAALIGVGIGTATSFAQADLNGTWQALSNSASPWLLGAFVAGAIQSQRRWAVTAGLCACLLEVAGYYLVTTLRGFPASETEILRWTGRALLGGPVFSWAGWVWRRGPARYQVIGGAFLPATFLGEAVGTYELRLHYTGDVVLYTLMGLVLLAFVVLGRGQVRKTILATVIVGLMGVVVYGFLI